MALRADEKFVKDCLIKYFDGETTAEEGEDPPDIYINVDGEKIAVEITRLSPVSFDQNGSVYNRNTQDYFGLNLCDQLDSQLKDVVPSDIDIILTLYVPVENARKYKNELYSYLKDFIAKDLKAGNKKETEIAGEKVNISVVPNRAHSQKKIVGIIVNKNSKVHILSNAEIILKDRIKEKQEKCKKIKHDGPIWLALFNDYWLADHEIYTQVIRKISIIHEFERIFVILDTGEVHQIYHKT